MLISQTLQATFLWLTKIFLLLEIVYVSHSNASLVNNFVSWCAKIPILNIWTCSKNALRAPVHGVLDPGSKLIVFFFRCRSRRCISDPDLASVSGPMTIAFYGQVVSLLRSSQTILWPRELAIRPPSSADTHCSAVANMKVRVRLDNRAAGGKSNHGKRKLLLSFGMTFSNNFNKMG